MIIKGDIDGDGRITPIDYQIVKLYILDAVTLTDYQFQAADVDDSGGITVTDYIKINEHILGHNMITEVI